MTQRHALRLNTAALAFVVALAVAIVALGLLDSIPVLSGVSLLTWIDTRLAAVLAGYAASNG